MTQKLVRPVVFGTIVMSPIVALQLVFCFPGTGIKPPSDAAVVAIIDIVFWFVILFMWRHMKRNRE